MEMENINYCKKMTKEYPCFDFWFTVDAGQILDFDEGNSGVGYIHGLPLNVVWNIVEGLKDEIEGNYQEELPDEDEHVIAIEVTDISYFGGQWSEDACAYEVHPGYEYGLGFKQVL